LGLILLRGGGDMITSSIEEAFIRRMKRDRRIQIAQLVKSIGQAFSEGSRMNMYVPGTSIHNENLAHQEFAHECR
jgi:hypothetical protein